MKLFPLLLLAAGAVAQVNPPTDVDYSVLGAFSWVTGRIAVNWTAAVATAVPVTSYRVTVAPLDVTYSGWSSMQEIDDAGFVFVRSCCSREEARIW